MITAARSYELDLLQIRGTIAGDSYYTQLDEQDFTEEMEDCDITPISKTPEGRLLYQEHLRQRTLGFQKYQTEISNEYQAVTKPEELHYLAKDYNFDDGYWPLEQIIKNPNCDIRTARMIFWHCTPSYFAITHGHPSDIPKDSIHADNARLLLLIDTKARKNGFATQLPDTYEDPEITDMAKEGPVWEIPDALWPQ